MDKNKTLLNLKTAVVMSISSIVYIKFIKLMYHKTKPINAFFMPQIDSIIPLLDMNNSKFIKNINTSLIEYLHDAPFDFDNDTIIEIGKYDNIIQYLVPDLASIVLETLVSKFNWDAGNIGQDPYVRMDMQRLENKYYINLIRYQFMLNLILLCRDDLKKEKDVDLDIVDCRDIITVNSKVSITPVHIRLEDIDKFNLDKLIKMIGLTIRDDGSLCSIDSNMITITRNDSKDDGLCKYIF